MTTDVDQRKSGGIVSVSGNAPAAGGFDFLVFVHLVGFCSIVLMLFAAWWIVLVLWDLDCLLWFRIVCVCVGVLC